jgi:hypothetical protein
MVAHHASPAPVTAAAEPEPRRAAAKTLH